MKAVRHRTEMPERHLPAESFVQRRNWRAVRPAYSGNISCEAWATGCNIRRGIKSLSPEWNECKRSYFQRQWGGGGGGGGWAGETRVRACVAGDIPTSKDCVCVCERERNRVRVCVNGLNLLSGSGVCCNSGILPVTVMTDCRRNLFVFPFTARHACDGNDDDNNK